MLKSRMLLAFSFVLIILFFLFLSNMDRWVALALAALLPKPSASTTPQSPTSVQHDPHYEARETITIVFHGGEGLNLQYGGDQAKLADVGSQCSSTSVHFIFNTFSNCHRKK